MGTISYLLLGRMCHLYRNRVKQKPLSTSINELDGSWSKKETMSPPIGDDPFSNTIKIITDIATDHWDIIALCLIFRSKQISSFQNIICNQVTNKPLDWMSLVGIVTPDVVACAYVFEPAFKQKMANDYNITRKTLDKWVKYWCKELNYEEYKLARKLNNEQVQLLVKELGNPFEQKPLTKGAILAITESISYRIVKENVIKLSEKHGYSLEAYKNSDILPPIFSKFLLGEMDGYYKSKREQP